MRTGLIFAVALFCLGYAGDAATEQAVTKKDAKPAPQISMPEIALPELVKPPTVDLPPDITAPEAQTEEPSDDVASITPFESSQNMISRSISVGVHFAEALKRGDRLRARFMMGLPFLAETRPIDNLTDLDRIFGPKLAPDRQPGIPQDLANDMLVGTMCFRTAEFRAIPFLAQQAAALQGPAPESYDFVVTLTYSDNGHYETMVVLIRRLPEDRLEVAGYINT